MARRWRDPKPPRGRFWGPGWGQANQGQAWASWIRQPGTAWRRGLRLLPSNRRRWDPAWPQANQGQAWASFTRQAGQLRAPARLLPSARRRWDPPWTRPPAPPQIIRPAGPLRFAATLRTRGRWYNPAWPQANQGQAWASFTRQAGPSPRFAARLARSMPRRADPPFAASVAVLPLPVLQPAGGYSMLKRSILWADL